MITTTTERLVRSMVVALAVAAGGCAPDADDAANSSGGNEYASTDTEAVRAASWERLRGAWEAADGSALYAHLVFTGDTEDAGHHYFGERVVTCVRAPCNPVREDGWFTAGTVNLTLHPDTAVLRLTYHLSGDNLTTYSGSRVVGRYHREQSYCAAAADCASQGLIVPACVGGFTCVSNACAYHCGRIDPCSTVRCAAGTHCTAPYDAPMCVADDPGPTCRTLTCARGYHCDDVSGRSRCVIDTDRCATVRCASGTHCVSSGSSASCVADGGGYGATCGGIAGLRCATGYTCVYASSSTTPDAAGYCHALSGEGESCGGGSIRFPAVCDTGLTCVGPAPGSAPGATGSCHPVTPTVTCRTLTCASDHHCEMDGTTARCVANSGGLGAFCGGIAAFRCATGFTCVLDGTYPDAGGECRPESGLGGACGGTTRYPAVCASGLHCSGPTPGSPLGAHGTCVR